MGLVSLGTNQFWGRILMFFMQPAKYPPEPYTKYVKPKRMHIFTLIQLGLFLLLYVVKSIKVIAIAFPIIIALCIPMRLFILTKIFTPEELVMIDTDEDTVKKWLAKKKDLEQKEKELRENSDEENQDEKPDANHHEDEDVKKETNDFVGILPSVDEIGSAAIRREKRANRRKSISCPSSSALESSFFENNLADRFEPSSFDGLSSNSDTDTNDIPDDPIQVRRRRRKKKTLSCPPHMLFAEAERQVNKNYFFG